MKCPKCGTQNGKTNKFCRECGGRLNIAGQTEPQGISGVDISALDDLALGSELFDVWQLYEAGELVEALQKGEKTVEKFPTSTSAHSVLALICERVAEREITIGDAEVARDYLKMAMSEYQTILALNPNSDADRQKLISIRSKLAGHKTVAPADVIAKIKSRLKVLPPPVLAAGVVFVVMVTLVTVLTSGARKSHPNSHQIKVSNDSASRATVSQSPVDSATKLRVYTFPAQVAGTAATPPASHSSSVPVTPRPNQSVQPIKLPPIGSELTLVAEPKKTQAKTEQLKPAQVKILSSGKNEVKIAPAQHNQSEPDSSQQDGSTLLAKAIQLHNEGQTQQAIAMADKALLAFYADVAAGKNVDSARRGASNAQGLASTWRSSN